MPGLIELVHEAGGRVVLDTSGPPLPRGAGEPAGGAEAERRGAAASWWAGRCDARGAVRAAARSLARSAGWGRWWSRWAAQGAVFVDRERALLARPPRVPVAARWAPATRWSPGSSTPSSHGSVAGRSRAARHGERRLRGDPDRLRMDDRAELEKLMAEVEMRSDTQEPAQEQAQEQA